MTRRRTVLLCLALGALALAGAAWWGWTTSMTALQAAVVRALGPNGEVERVAVGPGGIVLHGLRIRAGAMPGWPGDEEGRAERVHVLPDWRAVGTAWLGGGAWHVRRITIEGARLTLWRTRDGRMHVLPSVPDRRASGSGEAAAAAPPVVIRELVVADAEVVLHDSRVRRPAHRLALRAVQATAGPLHLPALDRPVTLSLEAALAGATGAAGGRIALSGTVTPSTFDARLTARADGIDLRLLQPYLLRSGEAAVRSGTLGLAIEATVHDKRLRAPGTVRLTGLELASGGGLLGTFAGVPRQAVLAAMQRNGRIDLAFELSGPVDDPRFSLQDTFAAELAVGLAQAVGVSVGGVVEGMGSVLRGLLGR
jgi:hypothetical protein